jgi:hypothetical protein
MNYRKYLIKQALAKQVAGTECLIKSAFTYELTGEALQTVGLRKYIHQLLQQRELEGNAVNNPLTGGILLTTSSSKDDQKEILSNILDYVSKHGGNVSAKEIEGSSKLEPVHISYDKVDDFFYRHGLKRVLEWPEPKRRQKWLIDRYRLKLGKTGLEGNVPEIAAKQLRVELPIYRAQLTNPDEFGPGNVFAKQAQGAAFHVGAKALWQALRGKRVLSAEPGMFYQQRQAAVDQGTRLMKMLGQSGINVHRARVKSPASMQAKGLTTVPDDLLGMQVYGKNQSDVSNVINALQSAGVSGLSSSMKIRPGYHGVNIKGTFGSVPMEMQVSPGIVSNVGQMMEHALGYKQLTEVPTATRFDKWVGKRVAPWLVRQSWMSRGNSPLNAQLQRG